MTHNTIPNIREQLIHRLTREVNPGHHAPALVALESYMIASCTDYLVEHDKSITDDAYVQTFDKVIDHYYIRDRVNALTPEKWYITYDKSVTEFWIYWMGVNGDYYYAINAHTIPQFIKGNDTLNSLLHTAHARYGSWPIKEGLLFIPHPSMLDEYT